VFIAISQHNQTQSKYGYRHNGKHDEYQARHSICIVIMHAAGGLNADQLPVQYKQHGFVRAVQCSGQILDQALWNRQVEDSLLSNLYNRIGDRFSFDIGVAQHGYNASYYLHMTRPEWFSAQDG